MNKHDSRLNPENRYKDICRGTSVTVSSGVSRISFRGGGGGRFKIFLEKWGYLHGAKRHAARGSHAFVRGVRGHAPPRNFFKIVQFGAF